MRTLVALACLLAALEPVAHAAAAPDRLVLPASVIPSHYDLAVVPDPAHLSFTATVKIDVDVAAPTDRIVLNAVRLKFAAASLADVPGTPVVSFDEAQQTATLKFAAPVAAGHHVLAIDYSGQINQSPAGLFALDYDSPQGKKRALFSQFENADARSFFPGWDEPNRKATFTLAVTVPAADMAVSNMPVASTETLDGGLKRVHFAETPKMSSYLLFFASGDFERISRKVGDVDVGVVVKRGDTDKAKFALDTAAQILPYYEDYFGVKYPLPKLDLIAGPGESQYFEAMENWGAIFYFENVLLDDPKITTDSDRLHIYTDIAHEMAHQWFGDLVTMDWWDDLWLNEGFASWMEIKAPDHFHPEWKLWLLSQTFREAAMGLDARPGTHPIITPIRDVLQAADYFDNIDYLKGQAVIRMLENYVGEDAFRAGVRAYMKDHAYGNTVTDDFWQEMDKATSVSVTDIAHQFTRQEGVPLIRVTAAPKGVGLSQDRYFGDGPAPDKTAWQVPIVGAWLGKTGAWRGLSSRGTPAIMPGKAADGVLINAGQPGYYRTLYSAAALKPLAAAFPGLSPEDQLGLLLDTGALGQAGYQPMSDFLALAGQAKPGMDPTVLLVLAQKLGALDHHYEGLSGQARFRAYGRGLLGPVLAAVGWTPQPGEDANTPRLREQLLATLGSFDDPEVIATARARFADLVKDPSSLSAELREPVLAIVAEHADAATWDQLHQLAKSTTSNIEKSDLYAALGAARDPALVHRALALVLTDEAEVTQRPGILRSAGQLHPDLVFDFVNDHYDAVTAMLEPESRSSFLPHTVGQANDAALIPKLRAYAAAHVPANSRKDFVSAEAAIASSAKFRKERLPAMDHWLQAHAKS